MLVTSFLKLNPYATSLACLDLQLTWNMSTPTRLGSSGIKCMLFLKASVSRFSKCCSILAQEISTTNNTPVSPLSPGRATSFSTVQPLAMPLQRPCARSPLSANSSHCLSTDAFVLSSMSLGKPMESTSTMGYSGLPRTEEIEGVTSVLLAPDETSRRGAILLFTLACALRRVSDLK